MTKVLWWLSMRLLTLDEGKFLVKLARDTIESYLTSGERPKVDKGKLTDALVEKRGVFTTLYKLVKGRRELRGCIGYPYPVKELYLAVMDTAIEAATNDPRFNPLQVSELNDVVVEVSVLTVPEKIEVSSPLEYPDKIVIGRDGLIIKYGFYSGLLLPQVPVEYNWDAQEYLSHLSMKAGLPPDAWLWKDVEIYRFMAQIFIEKEPYGDVVEEIIKR